MVRPSWVTMYGTPLTPFATSFTRHSLNFASSAETRWTEKRPRTCGTTVEAKVRYRSRRASRLRLQLTALTDGRAAPVRSA
eukprot:scaffold88602_cov64-Phaeocystis_antarctica.AAC.2